MKRIIPILMVLLLFAAVQVEAKVRIYNLYTGTADSGNTSVPLGGVSTFILEGGARYARSNQSTDLYTRDIDTGHGVFELSAVTIAQSQTGNSGASNYDNNTFSVFYRETIVPASHQYNVDAHWEKADRKRLLYDVKLSGESIYAIPFSFIPGNALRFYFESSGATAYDIAIAKLILGLPEYTYEVPKEKTYLLYLGTADSGNSTQPSSTGVSNMLVDGEKYKRSESTYVIDDTEKLVGDYFGFQVDTLTISQAQTSGASNYSGNTVTFRYKETMINETAHWDAAQYIDIITAMALSGNTRYQIELDLQALGFIRFYMATSGVTAWDFAKAKFIAR